mgnify:FL=1
MNKYEHPIQRMTMTWTRVYYHLAKAIIDKYGDEGENLVKQAAEKAGDEDGARMRQLAHDWKLGINPESLLKTMTYLWPENNTEGHPRYTKKDTRSFEITSCPIEEMFKSLPDGKKIGELWQRAYHPGLWSKFNSDYSLEVEASMIGGDKTTIYTQKFTK